MKEWISIILASVEVFVLWSTILHAWEDGRILDGTRSLPQNPALVGKSTLFPLVKLSESQFIELVNDPLAQKVSLHKRYVGGGDPHIKIMLEWSIAHKQKKVIRNEIMVHHGFPRPTSFWNTNITKEWKDMEVANDYND
jgi:hypothetical protein